MNFCRTLILSLALVATANASLAWEFVVERGGTKAFVDRARIKKKGEYLSVQWVANYSEPQRLKNGRNYLTKQSLLSQSLFDCDRRHFLIESSTFYDLPYAAGTGHSSSGRTNPQWWTPEKKVYQGNLNVDVMNAVCPR